MPTFLFKTEPSTYSFADLVRDRHTTWDGVSNALALIHLRTAKKGDLVVIYHSGDDRAAIGIARVTKAAYPDPKLEDPSRVVVDLEPVEKLARPVSLAEFRGDAVFKSLELVRNTRLSVMPMSDAQIARLRAIVARPARA
ncbi:MAG: EVE domain-containing protein [Candidatus Eisenbacteria bacterium]|uniref:EVE domain-containing protein n=1 Tax=Eiseniibacteriota bacterium TaxID=2212470 RepID=A0A849SS09_UNCEI|nr:EVE domain-containing protein [Candidatus Eisenbacteria bacterium]